MSSCRPVRVSASDLPMGYRPTPTNSQTLSSTPTSPVRAGPSLRHRPPELAAHVDGQACSPCWWPLHVSSPPDRPLSTDPDRLGASLEAPSLSPPPPIHPRDPGALLTRSSRGASHTPRTRMGTTPARGWRSDMPSVDIQTCLRRPNTHRPTSRDPPGYPPITH